MKDKVEYWLIQNCLVDPDLAMEKRQIIKENAVNVNGANLFTLTYQQVLQDFGVRNWNGRIYTENIVMNALDSNPLIQHDLKMGTWTAEYGHPQIEKGQNELARQMTIDPLRACNTIDKYWKEGNLLMGECTTLAGAGSPGEILRDRILTNYPAMASSRAIGGVDKQGNVLPGYTIITFDSVIRPSHKTAYMKQGSQKINNFSVGTNSMDECAVKYDYAEDPSFKDFLLSESVSKRSISMMCDLFKLDYDSMSLTENAGALTITSIEGNTRTKLIMPLHKLIGAEYYNLFK